jgi:hypothetical protein
MKSSIGQIIPVKGGQDILEVPIAQQQSPQRLVEERGPEKLVEHFTSENAAPIASEAGAREEEVIHSGLLPLKIGRRWNFRTHLRHSGPNNAQRWRSYGGGRELLRWRRP